MTQDFQFSCQEIRKLISQGRYDEAVAKYYESLGEKPFGELTQELLYLKRLGEIPLQGRDILAFRPKSSLSDFIERHIWEYCACMDVAMEDVQATGGPTPLQILIQCMPTTKQMIELFQQRENRGVSWEKGKLKKRRKINVTMEYLGHITFPEGKFFDRYPNMGIYQWMAEEGLDEVKYSALWVTLNPSIYDKEILSKGLCFDQIQTYIHAKWKIGTNRRVPDFMSLKSLKDVYALNYWGTGLKYTGRVHQIDEKDYYEVDLLEKVPWNGEKGPPFRVYVNGILREGENLLREKHGIPKIGEGWVSELLLFNLVKEIFPDAQHHARPDWLNPQELDIYVSSKKVAFEYQGLQHYELLDVFGGEEAFMHRQELDLKKKKKCRANGIKIIEWMFDEPIDHFLLVKKLENAKIKVE